VQTVLLLHTKQFDGHILPLTSIYLLMTLYINYNDI